MGRVHCAGLGAFGSEHRVLFADRLRGVWHPHSRVCLAGHAAHTGQHRAGGHRFCPECFKNHQRRALWRDAFARLLASEDDITNVGGFHCRDCELRAMWAA